MNTSKNGDTVSAILAAKYHIVIQPGKKGECPFCKHKTLSVKRDDTLAKCFHPVCGKTITPSQHDSGPTNRIFQVLADIFVAFHAALLGLADGKGPNAYSYVVQERRIHPQVVSDSMIGAVPAGFNVEEAFAPVIASLEAEATAAAGPKGPGQPKKSSPTSAQVAVKTLTEARDKLSTCLKAAAGWLAFFYTDAAHRVVAMRFRRPFSKEFLSFKPTAIGGLFNHGLFAPSRTPALQHLNDLLIVVEGEFNQLQLQSLLARNAELEGRPPEDNYVFAGAVGGVNNTDVETIRRLARTPVVCFDHDDDNAGFALVSGIAKAATVTAFTTPEPESDLDEYILSFGTNTIGALEAVKTLLAGRTLHARPFDALKNQIDAIRRTEGQKGGLKRFETNREVARIVTEDIKERGRVYFDGNRAFIFFLAEKALMEIQPENPDLELVLSRYGIAGGDVVFRSVLDALRLYALEHGERTRIYTFSHYDKERNTLYVFDLGQKVFKITPDDIDVVDNGTDGILFIRNATWTPFKLVPLDPDASPLRDLLLDRMRLREDSLSVGHRVLLFLVWVYSIFFPELFPTKVLLAFLGDRGSAKTFHLRLVGKILFGSSFDVTPLSSDSKDFDAAVTNTPFVVLDNVDSKQPWLDDRLATAATGGVIKRRNLFTTNSLVEYRVQAVVAITSRTPSFTREDVADRLLPFWFERLTSYIAESTLLEEVEGQRDRIMTELLGHLQEVLGAFQHQADKKYASGFRMADFAEFALRIAHGQGWGDHMTCILNHLAQEQRNFALENEMLIDLIDKWIESAPDRNQERELTAPELCAELASVAESARVSFEFRNNPRGFAQHLWGIISTLRGLFDVEERRHGGRRRTISLRRSTKGTP